MKVVGTLMNVNERAADTPTFLLRPGGLSDGARGRRHSLEPVKGAVGPDARRDRQSAGVLRRMLRVRPDERVRRLAADRVAPPACPSGRGAGRGGAPRDVGVLPARPRGDRAPA